MKKSEKSAGVSIRDFFLGQPVVLRVGRRKVQARRLPGTNDVFIGEGGEVMLPRWQSRDQAETLKTPLQRSRKKRDADKEKGWAIYPSGLPSALRGRKLALLRARRFNLPTLEKALRIFEGSVRANLFSAEPKLDSRRLPAGLRDHLRRFGFAFRRAKKPGVKEVLVQIWFLHRDYQGGLNVGAMLARNVAITDRLRESLAGLYAWSAKYSAQERVLQAFQEYIYALLREAERQLDLLHQSGRQISPAQKRAVADKLVMMAQDIKPLKAIQPFSRWAMFMFQDLQGAYRALRSENVILFQALIERLMFSLELKRRQQEIDSFLLWFGEGEILDQQDSRSKAYADWALRKAQEFQASTEKEEEVGLREEVCFIAGSFLAQAVGLADHKKWPAFKRAVKEAHAVL